MTQRFVLLAALVGLAGVYAQEKFAKSDAKPLTTDELKQLVDNKEKFFFLDVREPGEIAELGTLKDYVNIPLGQLESRLNEVPKGAAIIVACNRGARAGKGADVLKKHGYTNVSYCGLREWKQRGYELVYPKEGEKQK